MPVQSFAEHSVSITGSTALRTHQPLFSALASHYLVNRHVTSISSLSTTSDQDPPEGMAGRRPRRTRRSARTKRCRQEVNKTAPTFMWRYVLMTLLLLSLAIGICLATVSRACQRLHDSIGCVGYSARLLYYNAILTLQRINR